MTFQTSLCSFTLLPSSVFTIYLSPSCLLFFFFFLRQILPVSFWKVSISIMLLAGNYQQRGYATFLSIFDRYFYFFVTTNCYVACLTSPKIEITSSFHHAQFVVVILVLDLEMVSFDTVQFILALNLQSFFCINPCSFIQETSDLISLGCIVKQFS